MNAIVDRTMMQQALAGYESTKRAIQTLETADAAKHIADKAEAMRVYAKQANDTELQYAAMRLRLHSMRRAGILAQDNVGENGKPAPLVALRAAGFADRMAQAAHHAASLSEEEFREKCHPTEAHGRRQSYAPWTPNKLAEEYNGIDPTQRKAVVTGPGRKKPVTIIETPEPSQPPEPRETTAEDKEASEKRLRLNDAATVLGQEENTLASRVIVTRSLIEALANTDYLTVSFLHEFWPDLMDGRNLAQLRANLETLIEALETK